ncbi:MAG: DUF2267 domain-containing protein [Elusimicrobia bacterium]|nr:DUF2267 domain-containing protein [Elusimicrobiota bacterium]
MLESSAQKTRLWLKDVAEGLHATRRLQAYSALRCVLHALRDCLPPGEVAKFASQMPLVIRGVYYDGWKPRPKPRRMTRQEFYDQIRGHLRSQPDVDPALATQAVIQALYAHMSLGELQGLQRVLPREVRELWREVEGELFERPSEAPAPAGRRSGNGGPRRKGGPGSRAGGRPGGGRDAARAPAVSARRGEATARPEV